MSYGKRLLLGILLLLPFVSDAAHSVALEDVTAQWTFHGRVISAFPKAYDRIKTEENADIIKVFQFRQSGYPASLSERRIEVFYTGGDWMPYGLVYFVSNAVNPAYGVHEDEVAAYFIPDLSTSDLENGATAPRIDPFNTAALEEFITSRFLDNAGDVRSAFQPLSP